MRFFSTLPTSDLPENVQKEIDKNVLFGIIQVYLAMSRGLVLGFKKYQ